MNIPPELIEYILSYTSYLPLYSKVSHLWYSCTQRYIDRLSMFLKGHNIPIMMNKAVLNDRWDFILFILYKGSYIYTDIVEIAIIFNNDTLCRRIYRDFRNKCRFSLPLIYLAHKYEGIPYLEILSKYIALCPENEYLNIYNKFTNHGIQLNKADSEFEELFLKYYMPHCNYSYDYLLKAPYINHKMIEQAKEMYPSNTGLINCKSDLLRSILGAILVRKMYIPKII